MPPSNLYGWIALNLLPGLGTITRISALRKYGSPEEVALRVPAEDLLTLTPHRRENRTDARSRINGARKTLRRHADRELARCRKAGITVLSLDDQNYPAWLRQIPDPPVVLYISGRLDTGRTRVALVGSRRASPYGRRTARSLSAGLAACGVETVSGGARGIDTISHRGSLDAGGETIAVLGSGLFRPYPRENLRLFEKIARNGAVLSEFPLEYAPAPYNFPRRNRIISGLCAAVIVVEATEKSGSLITAAHALDQGREVLAVPGPVASDLSEGCNRLIREGATLIRGVEDVLDELPVEARARLSKLKPERSPENAINMINMNHDEKLIVSLLNESETLHIDSLAERSGIGVNRLQIALFSLEVRGAVEQSPGRYYLLRPREEF